MSVRIKTGYKIGRGQLVGDTNFSEQFSAIALEIQKLPDDRTKRSKILMILRRQMKPVLAAVVRDTPESEKDVKFRGEWIKKGTLKRSMAIKTSPMKHYPNVLVGPTVGTKAKFDGWYTFFLQYGTYRIKPNDFIAKAAEPLMRGTERSVSRELEQYISKEAKKLQL